MLVKCAPREDQLNRPRGDGDGVISDNVLGLSIMSVV